MSKTNFDLFLEEQLRDPDFARRFEKAGVAWDVALQLAALREEAGLSQADLARRLKTTQQQISRLESLDYEGHSLSMLRRVARVLNTQVRVVFEGSETTSTRLESKRPARKRKENEPPSLKSASGAGFSFEDKVAATLLCEMLAGIPSLGTTLGIVQRLERQAGDWEPFGDLLLELSNSAGDPVKCGVSVKSNRQITANGFNRELCSGLWTTMDKPTFASDRDFLSLLGAALSPAVTDHLNSLILQARSIDAERLDEKVVHAGVRKIYQSFRNPTNTAPDGLPGRALARFLHREFDFEANVSESENAALHVCRDALSPDEQTEEKANDLWKVLCEVAHQLRISGGAVTREDLSAKLRCKFRLRDDPCDTAAWSRIRSFSREGLQQIEVALPGDLRLPRTAERDALRLALADQHFCHVLGDSGSGKSALIKEHAAETEINGAEIVWVRADRFNQLVAVVPDFIDVAKRCRRTSALLVIDALEGCVTPESFVTIARVVDALATTRDCAWSVIFACQTPEWARVHTALVKHLAGNSALTKRVDCGALTKDDLDLVCLASPSVAKLVQEPQLRRVLSSPKMLDILLTGQLAEDRALAGEGDLVEWWWEQRVRGPKMIAAEERVARELASRMADELCSELPPDSVRGAEEAASELIRNRVLRRTPEGLLRFAHDLLADWARVMHLKGLGKQTVSFIRGKTENPPWLRAVRLLSQHLLDRVADLDQWRGVLSTCKTERPHVGPSAENLQVIDAWLEGIIFSLNPACILMEIKSDLFESEGWLLRRLIRRLMYVGTFPDPVVQDRFSKIDSEFAEAAAAQYRLPMWNVWSPFVEFLVAHSQDATDMAPVEIAEIAPMWARMEQYLNLEWPALANLIIRNAEKEFRREVGGEYRHHSGSRSLSGRSNSRVTIYGAALQASSQAPERVMKLVAKAAGIAPWDEGDLNAESRDIWRGQWENSRSSSFGGSYVEVPVTAWEGGPTRETSDDFFHAWFDPTAPLAVYRHFPKVACEVTLGFLIDWPKRALFRGDHHSSGIDHYGFNFEADHLYPPFYTKGPFLSFLRADWHPALRLIIQLTNFATNRYADWWPYDPKPGVFAFPTPTGETSWLGNHQVYAWGRYHMNTAHVVTCALMALEKWLEEQVQANQSIVPTVQILWQSGQSLAFAGTLIAVGKRHPELFVDALKPLLFVRELYMHDMHAVREGMGAVYWPRDGEFINNLRREWELLPGRKTGLLDACCEWLLTRSDLQPVLAEVADCWRDIANKLPEEAEEKIVLRRWASNFDLSMWKEITLSDGSKAWQNERPDELRDAEGEQAHARHQALITLPFQCSEMLDNRPVLSPKQLEGIWQQLHNWTPFEQHTRDEDDDDKIGSSLLDHRHAKAGLIAVLLCLGGEWLDDDSSRRPWVEEELRKLLLDSPKVTAFSADDIHDDCEGFLARGAVQCWANAPDNEEWRRAVGSLVAVYRYRTIQRLFDEAFRSRRKLGKGFREFEALLLSFAGARQKAGLESFKPQPEMIDGWVKQWVPRFARGRGPKWADDWTKIEITEPFPPPSEHHYGIPGQEWHRRDYGSDINVLLSSFGTLPSLAEAASADERLHWMRICKELLSAYLRTLPFNESTNEEDDWDFQPWSADEKIIKIVAARLFQCSGEEQGSLWFPILSLPPAAHHHITQFLSNVLLEAIRTDPPQLVKLLSIWRAMAEHLLASPRWTGDLRRKENEVWKYIFLYGSSVTSPHDKDHVPFVRGLHDLFESHVKAMDADPYDQSSLAAFLLSDAGEQLLVDSLEWLNPSWQKAGPYFWKRAVEHHYFEGLLQRAWQKHFAAIRERPDALKAFKVLTLNLASLQVPAAVEIQRQVGSA
jgi:transcriptional regulator with XRE-family HTH domain